MKIFFVCAAALLIASSSSSSFGREVSRARLDNYSSDLMSLNYYPHEGTFEVTPKLSTAFHDDSKSDNGTIVATTYNQLFLTAAYGIAPRMRVSISDNLLWDHLQTTTTSTGSASNATSTGFSNPTVTYTYRAIEAPSSQISVDVGVNVSPSFGAHEAGEGASNHTGNNLSGDWTAGASSGFYWRSGINELRLGASVTRAFGTTGANSNTAPFWTKSASIDDRVHLSPNFYLDLSGTGNFDYETFATNKNTDVTTDTHTDFYIQPALAAGYRGSKHVALELAMMYRRNYADTDSSNATKGESHLTYTQAIGTFTIRHDFQ